MAVSVIDLRQVFPADAESVCQDHIHEEQAAPRSIPLRAYVRCFTQRKVRLDQMARMQPVMARVEQVIAFQFGEHYRVQHPGGTTVAPGLLIAGPQTFQRARLLLSGSIDSFYVFFRPAGIYHLFGVPMSELSDRSLDAGTVLGRRIVALQDLLSAAVSFAERMSIAERFLLTCIGRHAECGPIDRIAELIKASGGMVTISALASEASISGRQLERSFLGQIGMPPKKYARIVRFRAALTLRLCHPERSWTDLAHECGYYDQMHLIRDFQMLSGATPGQIVQQLALLRPESAGSA